MARKSIKEMLFKDVYAALVKKAEKKQKTKEEVDTIIRWMSGYTNEQLQELVNSEIKYGMFFEKMPNPNPNRHLIKGKICGVNIEEIEDLIIKEIRYLDKLIDELSKGKAIDRILRK